MRLIFLLVSSLLISPVHAGTTKSKNAAACAPSLKEILGDPKATIDSLLEELSLLDSELASTRQQVFKFGKTKTQALNKQLVVHETAAAELFEALSVISETDNVKKTAASKKIRELRSEAKQISDSVVNDTNASSLQTTTLVKKNQFVDLEDFDAVEALLPYSVSNGEARTLDVVFTANVLKDLLDIKLDARVRQALLQALKNGVVSANGLRGIKLMKMFDGTAFVEVKTIGGVAGEFRIYGCSKGSNIVLYFLGRDMNGVGDPQRDKIRALCK